MRVRCRATGGGDNTGRFVHDESLGQANYPKHESTRGRSGILLRRVNFGLRAGFRREVNLVYQRAVGTMLETQQGH